MESILSIHDDAYPVRSRRNKSSSPYLINSLQMRRNTLNHSTNILSISYQYFRTIIAHRTLYIFGVLNLILAGIAILCVTHAEDHPEYFFLVYIAISIFIFYMIIILLIIILQIIETYKEKHQRNHSSSSFIQMPLITSQKLGQPNPIIVECMKTKPEIKTRLSRSHTIALTSPLINPHQTLSTSTSSSTLKDFNPLKSTRFTLPQTPQINLNFPRNYQSFALTTNEQFSPSFTTITNNDNNSQLSSLLKSIPIKYHVNSENKRFGIQFSEY